MAGPMQTRRDRRSDGAGSDDCDAHAHTRQATGQRISIGAASTTEYAELRARTAWSAAVMLSETRYRMWYRAIACGIAFEIRHADPAVLEWQMWMMGSPD